MYFEMDMDYIEPSDSFLNLYINWGSPSFSILHTYHSTTNTIKRRAYSLNLRTLGNVDMK
jgi:hypothetical protein